VNLAPAVRHGRRAAGLACPLGSSTAAGSSVRHNQGLKARPHALNRFALARQGLKARPHALNRFALARQGLKARPHALNRFALARKRFIAHF
jgi:hypothetical protein